MEQKIEAEKLMVENTAAKEEEQRVQFLGHEIECPRCRDNMESSSDFDNMYYVCNECDFCRTQ